MPDRTTTQNLTIDVSKLPEIRRPQKSLNWERFGQAVGCLLYIKLSECFCNKYVILSHFKSWISSGSESLYKATYQRAYVANVKILIPETWSEVEAIITDELVLEVILFK